MPAAPALHARIHLLDWTCPNCETVNTVNGRADVVACGTCSVSQLAYTVEFSEHATPEKAEAAKA